MALLADAPEVVALAQLASVPASRLVSAFNQPEAFFEHLTLEELERLKSACERLGGLQTEMLAAMDRYAEEAQKVLASEVDRAD